MKTVSSDKIRNPYAPLAKKRKSGKIRSKKDKRRNGKNKQQEFLKEANEWRYCPGYLSVLDVKHLGTYLLESFHLCGVRLAKSIWVKPGTYFLVRCGYNEYEVLRFHERNSRRSQTRRTRRGSSAWRIARAFQRRTLFGAGILCSSARVTAESS